LRHWLLVGCVLLLAAPCRAQPEPMRPVPGTAFSLTIPVNRPVEAPRLSMRAWLEMGAVALTGVGHLAFSAHDASGIFIPIAAGGWGGYVGYRAATEPGFLGDLGLTGRELGPAFRDASLLAAGALAGMAAVGAAQGTLDLDADFLPLFVLYPLWGVVQQTLVQGFVTRHLAAAGISPWAVAPASAVAFGAVHLPNWKLTAATTVLGAAYAPLYLRHRNVWPLGLYHGVLGAFYYRWVLDRNPWQEIVDEL
jgi:membrane protease YdiL (CAAX protease family)